MPGNELSPFEAGQTMRSHVPSPRAGFALFPESQPLCLLQVTSPLALPPLRLAAAPPTCTSRGLIQTVRLEQRKAVRIPGKVHQSRCPLLSLATEMILMVAAGIYGALLYARHHTGVHIHFLMES